MVIKLEAVFMILVKFLCYIINMIYFASNTELVCNFMVKFVIFKVSKIQFFYHFFQLFQFFTLFLNH